MAIGYTITQGSVNNKAGLLATQWQQLAYNSQQFANEITANGGGTWLVSLGFSSGDATAMLNIAAAMAALSGVYYGTAMPLSAGYNYDNAFAILRGTGPG